MVAPKKEQKQTTDYRLRSVCLLSSFTNRLLMRKVAMVLSAVPEPRTRKKEERERARET